MPFLEEYFGLLARATPAPLDIEAAARAELDWWQARQEAIAPQTYGAMIAQVSALLYGRKSEKLREAGVLRAEAIAFRDARDGAITDADGLVICGRPRLARGFMSVRARRSGAVICPAFVRGSYWPLALMISAE